MCSRADRFTGGSVALVLGTRNAALLPQPSLSGTIMTAYAKAKGVVGEVFMQDDYNLRRAPCVI